ncbi:hypothetical protein BRD13_03615 [Halobacteriales archaeon SW_5_70_135]|nr:MAG: hypothetical protein BRD13_03615 [Halobacteriales archaeon SW_5_70_135]
MDVVVVERGGGSETDLDAFDTETVAEAIVTAETPVVAAVGHTEDDTVAGDVADVDAITPTEAGSVVAPLEATRERLDEIDERLSVAYDRRASAAVDALAGRVDDAYRAAAGRELSRLARDLRAAYARRVSPSAEGRPAASSESSGDEEAEYDGSGQDHDEEEGAAQDDEHPGVVSVEHAFGVVGVWFAGRDVHGESPRGCGRRTLFSGPNQCVSCGVFPRWRRSLARVPRERGGPRTVASRGTARVRRRCGRDGADEDILADRSGHDSREPYPFGSPQWSAVS